MALNVPAGIPATGKLSVTIIPEADVASGDLAALSIATIGATSVNTSCHLLSDGYARASEVQSTDRRRACDEVSYSVITGRTVTFEQMRFVYDPQGADTDLNKVYDALTVGENYYILERLGVSGKTELAASDVYDLYHVRLDTKDKLPPADGELEFGAQFTNLGSVTRDGVLAA